MTPFTHYDAVEEKVDAAQRHQPLTSHAADERLGLTQPLNCSHHPDPWTAWVKVKLRRDYLAIKAEANRDALAYALRLAQKARFRSDAASVGVVAMSVLDGAPEYSRALAEAHKYNGNEEVVKRIQEKDSLFFSYWCDAVKLYGGTVLDSDEARTYQDGGAAVFPSGEGEGAVAAIAAAYRLHTVLAEHNESQGMPWTERSHARLVIGMAWQDVLSCLRYVSRGQTIIDGQVWDCLGENLQKVLFASGVRHTGPMVLPSHVSEYLKLRQASAV